MKPLIVVPFSIMYMLIMKRFRNSRLIKLKQLVFIFLIWNSDFRTNISWAWLKWKSIKFIFNIINSFFFSINCLLCVLNVLQTAQNIRPLSILKQFFCLFEFSYFIFHILSYFCCRMVTLPVTQNKEGNENYFPKRKNCWQNKFLQYLFMRYSTPDTLFCGRNLYNLYQ